MHSNPNLDEWLISFENGADILQERNSSLVDYNSLTLLNNQFRIQKYNT